MRFGLLAVSTNKISGKRGERDVCFASAKDGVNVVAFVLGL